MSLPTYPEYKDSGVPWLGPVPAHWGVCSLKRIAKLQSGESITADAIEPEGPYPVYGGNGLRGYAEQFTHEGCFALIGRQGALCGNVNYSRGKFWASEHAVVATPMRPVETTWLGELLRAMNLNQYSVSAAQPGLSVEAISNLGVPVPPRSEQTSIARFLEGETAKIDALIAEQEKLLALLAEKCQATISHAVTRGLDPNAPMKDSGIPWLGEVPVHWVIAKLGHFATVENGTTPSRSVEEYWQGGDIPWLASGEVNQLQVTEASEFITRAALENCSLRLLPAGTVVVGMIGQGKTRGMSAMLCIPAAINQNLAAICPGQRIEGSYVLYVMHAVYEWLREAGRGGNQAAMNCEMLSALRIPVPGVGEQREIVAFIETETARIDTLVADAKRAIVLLKERRSALIAAVVTGKIDVRGLVEVQAA